MAFEKGPYDETRNIQNRFCPPKKIQEIFIIIIIINIIIMFLKG